MVALSMAKRKKSRSIFFFQCDIAGLFWFARLLQLDMQRIEGVDFLEYWALFLKKFEQCMRKVEILQLLVFSIWRL